MKMVLKFQRIFSTFSMPQLKRKQFADVTSADVTSVDACQQALELDNHAMKEMTDTKAKDIASENTKFMKREFHLADDSTCELLREALQNLDKLKGECAAKSDENATLREQLQSCKVARHEERGKFDLELIQNQKTISQLRDQLEQQNQTHQRLRAEMDELARKSVADEADMEILRTESRRAILTSYADIHKLKTCVKSRDDVITEMKTRLDEQKKCVELCEGRMRYLEEFCSRLQDDLRFYSNESRIHFDSACTLQRDIEQWRNWYQHRYGDDEKKIIDVAVLAEREEGKITNLVHQQGHPCPPPQPPRTSISPPAHHQGRPYPPPQSPRSSIPPLMQTFVHEKRPPFGKSPRNPNNKQMKQTMKFAPKFDKFKSKRERRISNLRKQPIWRREN